MKVLVYKRKGFARYIPLLSGRYLFDYDINQEIMPPKLFNKINKRTIKANKNPNADFTLPIGVNSLTAIEAGCEIITMTKSQYESKKDELVTP